MTNIKNTNNQIINFEAATLMMDDDLCEELYNKMAPCTKQNFFTAYEQAHLDKFGEQWELSKANPVW